LDDFSKGKERRRKRRKWFFYCFRFLTKVNEEKERTRLFMTDPFREGKGKRKEKREGSGSLFYKYLHIRQNAH